MIKKVYDNLVKNGIYHNDLRLKNILYNENLNKIYLIDFENSSNKYTDTDYENLVKKIKNLKKTYKKTKKKTKRSKRTKRNKTKRKKKITKKKI